MSAMADYECPECKRQMAIVFVGDGTAYDECDNCGTATTLYDIVTGAEVEA